MNTINLKIETENLNNMQNGEQKNTFKVNGEANLKFNNRLVNFACIVLPLVFIFAIFAIIYLIYGVYPFGGNTVSSYDMLAQVAPYIEHFFDVIEGKSSLFYSYAIAGGADVFGTLAYCCVSPFTFLFLLFGRGNVYYGTAFVLPLKIACVYIAGYVYLKKRFKNINPIVTCALAISYAFCGYLFVSNTYINWVDLLIWLPIFAYGFKNVIEGKKKTLFILGASLMIYTCFSISCFSLLTIFPIMMAYCLIVIEKSKRKKIVTDIVISLCLTVVVCLPILLPSLWAFLVSGRKTGLFDNLLNDIKPEPLYYKASYLFIDGLTLLFTLVYFLKYGVNRPIDRFLVVSACFIFAPVFVDQVMNLLNFGSYMSYALRFGFLTGFYFLYVASLYFDEFYKEYNKFEISEKTKPVEGVLQNNELVDNSSFVQIENCEKTFNEQSKNESLTKKRFQLSAKKQRIVFTIGLFVLIIGAIIGLLILNKSLLNGKFVESFSGRFAHSLGGLEATAIVCAIVAIIALYAHLLMKNNKLSKYIAIPVLLFIVCVQSLFYTTHLVVGNRYHPARWSQIGALTNYVKELDGHGNSRVKMNGDYLTADMPFTLKTNAFTVFSSVTDARNFVPTSFFEFGGNGINTMKSYNGTVLGDSALGYKYFISDKAVRSYLNEVDGFDKLTDEYGNIIDVGEYTLYENPYVFPSAFTVYSIPASSETHNKYENYSALLESYTGKKDALGVFELPASNVIEQDVEGVFRVKNVLRGAGNYYFYFDFEDYENIYYVKGGSYETKNQNILPQSKVITLGYGSGGSYSVCLKRKSGEPLTKEYIMEHVKTFCVFDSTVEEISNRAKAENNTVELSAGKITVKTSGGEGSYLCLNYIYLPDGHTVKVNGRVAQFEDNLLNFMYVKLDAGENMVEIEYQSPYVKVFLIGVLFALVMMMLYLLFFVKLKITLKKLQGVIEYCAYTLAGGIVAFFFIMPIGVFIYKGILLIINTVKNLF